MTTFVKTLGFNLWDLDEFSPIHLSPARTLSITLITRVIAPTSSDIEMFYFKIQICVELHCFWHFGMTDHIVTTRQITTYRKRVF